MSSLIGTSVTVALTLSGSPSETFKFYLTFYDPQECLDAVSGCQDCVCYYACEYDYGGEVHAMLFSLLIELMSDFNANSIPRPILSRSLVFADNLACFCHLSGL